MLFNGIIYVIQAIIYFSIYSDRLQFHYNVYYLSAPSLYETIFGTIFLWIIYLCVAAFIAYIIYEWIKVFKGED